MNSSSFSTNPDANTIRNRCFIEIRRENDASDNGNQPRMPQDPGTLYLVDLSFFKKSQLYTKITKFFKIIQIKRIESNSSLGSVYVGIPQSC